MIRVKIPFSNTASVKNDPGLGTLQTLDNKPCLWISQRKPITDVPYEVPELGAGCTLRYRLLLCEESSRGLAGQLRFLLTAASVSLLDLSLEVCCTLRILQKSEVSSLKHVDERTKVVLKTLPSFLNL